MADEIPKTKDLLKAKKFSIKYIFLIVFVAALIVAAIVVAVVVL
jgi:hypothetical protein